MELRTIIGWGLIVAGIGAATTGTVLPLAFQAAFTDYSDYEDVVAKGTRVSGIVDRAGVDSSITINGINPPEIDVKDESGEYLVVDYKIKPGYSIQVGQQVEMAKLGDKCYPVAYRPMQFPNFLWIFPAVFGPMGLAALIAGVVVLRKRNKARQPPPLPPSA